VGVKAWSKRGNVIERTAAQTSRWRQPKPSLFTLREREYLSGICKWNWSFAWRIEGSEQENEKCNETDPRGAATPD